MIEKKNNFLLDPQELGQSIDQAFSIYLKKKKMRFLKSIRFISSLKIIGTIYSVLLSYFVASTVELATLSGFSNTLLFNLAACFILICSQYLIGSIRGDESLKLGSKMDQGFVENISQLSLYSQVTLTPLFVSFVKELRVARTEYIPELITIGISILSFLIFAHLKNAFLVFLPMVLVFVFFLFWSYRRRKEVSSTWDIQERLIGRGLKALEESDSESGAPFVDEMLNMKDVKMYFALKVISFKEDFVTKSLIILSAINAALIFSSTKHPDRIVLSTLGLFAAKMLQDAVPVWLEVLRTKEIAKSINWKPFEKDNFNETRLTFTGEFQLYEVSFKYSNQAPLILNNLSFKVEKGDTLLISGPSGSGKSTFLKIVTGEIKPKSGNIIYEGLTPEEAPAGFYKMAGVMTHDCIFPNIKIDDLFSWFDSYSERKEMVLDCVELHPRTLQLHYSSLSQGEKKKIAIAVAIFQSQGIILLDEPYSGFDHNYGLRLAAKLAQLPFIKVITVTDEIKLTYSVIKSSKN